jgi:hypothetical protein
VEQRSPCVQHATYTSVTGWMHQCNIVSVLFGGCPSRCTPSQTHLTVVLLAAMHLPDSRARDAVVFGIVFDHPTVNTHPSVLRAAARACKAWREAVQQCGACNTAVVLPLPTHLPHLCSFARWLPKHAALVSSIRITVRSPRSPERSAAGADWKDHVVVF